MSDYLYITHEVNRLKPPLGKTTEYQSGSMTVEGSRKDDTIDDKIGEMIRQRHPGWKITGWHLHYPGSR